MQIKKLFYNQIQNLIQKHQIKSILVAVSGGQDSICLIKLIQDLRKKNIYINISYIYVDHQWKSESRIHIEHIINYLKYFKENIIIYQIKNIVFSENLTRKDRYNIIISHAIKNNYDVLMTAHTKTDKIETFLQNLIRGTTIEGTNSLVLNRKITNKLHFFRPLISINRNSIYYFCRYYFLPIWSDMSNYNYKISRNRIREELIPYITKYFNYSFEKNIVSFLKNCYNDSEYIKQKAISYYLYNKHDKYIALDCKVIYKKHISLQKKIIQIFLYHSISISINNYLLIEILYLINRLNKKNKIRWNNFQFQMRRSWLYIRYIKLK